MGKKINNFLKNELKGVKNIIKDATPRFVSLLNPEFFHSREALIAGISNIGIGYVTDRIKGFMEELFNKKEDFDVNVMESEKSKQVFIDLIKFAAQDNPDVEVWKSSKKIFIDSLSKNVSDNERNSLYELISICKTLSGTEIRIIAASSELIENKDVNNHVNLWASNVSKEMGFKTAEEVLRYEDNLLKQKLIAPRESLRGDIHGTWTPSGGSMGHRLTPLGRILAEELRK